MTEPRAAHSVDQFGVPAPVPVQAAPIPVRLPSSPTIGQATAQPAAQAPRQSAAPVRLPVAHAVSQRAAPAAVRLPAAQTIAQVVNQRQATAAPAWTAVPAAQPRPAPRRKPVTERLRSPSRSTALRIMCWQLVIVSAVLAIGRPWYVITAVTVGCLLLLALTVTRIRGRWPHEWAIAWTAYLVRRRAEDLPADAGPALLRHLAPEATGITATVNAEPVFMLSQAAGLIAVLQPRSTARDLTKAIPTPGAMLPPADEQSLAFAVRVVHHAGVKRDRPPRVWVALQALRTVDTHRDSEVQLALGNALRRVRRQLRRAGLPTRTLPEPEVLGTLAALSHTNAGRGKLREHWQHWRSGPIHQAAFRLDGWADLAPDVAAQLLRWLLTAAPGASITVSVTARRLPDRGDTEVDATVRIATMGEATLAEAGKELTRLAQERGITLNRLDGHHTHGLADTLPLGS
ncbi:type VII secretion protein EccE [Actinokineospora sp. HUAS TT18]|uniref:type VII secretion protein EccE n=1 Tax=Actinokineospora sp. HUAS TT18 TaxID=3447451 RepID=UPI003F5255E0